MRRPLALIAAAYALALFASWPLALHVDDRIPQDLGDPLLQAWQLAWGGFAVLHRPFDLFQANAFWPLENSLAFSDALIGYLPVGIAEQIAVALGADPLTTAVVGYNLLYLTAWALPLAAGFALARELGSRPVGAAVAGLAFAYAPVRLAHAGHLNILSSGGIALALYLLARGYRRGRPGLVVAGWAVAAWQVSLGFGLGMPFLYLLAVSTAATSVLVLMRCVRVPPGKVVAATGAGVVLVVASAGLLALPYLEVLEDHPEARRGPAIVAGYSPPPEAIVAAPEASLLWAAPTASARDHLSAPAEQTLFLGVATPALALVGLLYGRSARPLRVTLAVAAAVFGVLAFGFQLEPSWAEWAFPYRLLYELGPGWEGIRSPGRLMIFATLALAALAAFGADRVVERAGRRGRLAAVLVAGAVLLDGVGRPPAPSVPERPTGIDASPAPAMHLPAGYLSDVRYMLWSVDGFPALVNGASGFEPTSYRELVAQARDFPSARAVRALQRRGVRSVVLHRDLASGTAWRDAATRAVVGLGLDREEFASVVVYRFRARPSGR